MTRAATRPGSIPTLLPSLRANPSPPAIDVSAPNPAAPAGIETCAALIERSLPKDAPAPRTTPSPPATELPTPRGCAPAGNPSNQPPAKDWATSMAVPPSGWLELRLYAEMFNDFQKAHRAAENQIRSGTVGEDFANIALGHLKKLEQLAGVHMRATFKRTCRPVYDWSQSTRGVGVHTIARILGAIGDPLIATPHHWEGEGAARVLVADEPYPRNVAKLWAYCGVGDPDRKAFKGMTATAAAALGNPRAKMLIHVAAESQVKSLGAYYHDYLAARDQYATRDGWTPLHQHNAALRRVKKLLLRDIWRVAKGVA